MASIALVVLVASFVQRYSVDGQSTFGSDEANGMNSATEILNTILREISDIQNRIPICINKCRPTPDVRFLGQRLNTITQTLHTFSDRFETLEKNIQNGIKTWEDLQSKINSSQIENLLDRNHNKMLETLSNLNNKLEALDQNVQSGSELSQGLQIRLQNLTKLHEVQVTFLRSLDRKLQEHDQYYDNQSLASSSANQDARGQVTWPAYIRSIGKTVTDVYQVYPLRPGIALVEISVYYDTNSSEANWLVFQRRKDGSENFEKTWIEYENGFGDLRGEFWLGNKALHRLTSNGNYKLRIELEDFEGQKRYAEYSQFIVGPASDNYRLNISGYSGNAGNDMAPHNNCMFSTKDADHDGSGRYHCAQKYRGAWWYADGHSANLNGLYLRGNHTSFADGFAWQSFRGYYYSLKYVEMKIAPRN